MDEGSLMAKATRKRMLSVTIENMQANCWFKDQKMNFIVENTEENKLFMACVDTDHMPSDLWFVDSGCSNHMTSTKSLFKTSDETQKIKVQLGNKREMQVKGKGTHECAVPHQEYEEKDHHI